VRGSRDDQRRLFRGTPESCDLLLEKLGAERIRLAQRDDLGLVGEPVTVCLQLVAHRLVVLAGMLAGTVDQM